MKRSGPPARRTPIKRTGPIKARRKKPTAGDWRRMPKWLSAVRAMSCAHCGKARPSEAAHVRWNGSGGMGMKPPDCYVIPLCTACHRSQHQGGAPDSPVCWGHLLTLMHGVMPSTNAALACALLAHPASSDLTALCHTLESTGPAMALGIDPFANEGEGT